MKKKPNILFLMTDEQRFDVNGFSGNEIIRTPVMDRIAENGVVFTNVYSPSPACIPARQCLAAGQLTKTCKVHKYGDDLTPGYPTWASLLSQYAYMTTACGKLHHMGIDDRQGWLRRIGSDHMQSPIRGKQHIPGLIQEELDKYIPHKFRDPAWDPIKEIKRAGIGDGPFTNVWDDYTTIGAKNMVNEYFLGSEYDKDESFLPHVLYVGFNAPHYPYFADKEKFEYYLNRVPVYLNQKPFDHPVLGTCSRNNKPVLVGDDVTNREMQRATAAYYANIEQCDIRFGDIMETIEHVGENLDDWIIILTTDHGEMLGEHSIWEKARFFEGSVKVPLIISWPKNFSKRVVNENVNLCDLYATICDLCEIPIPEGLDSRSLVPLMNGNNKDWNNESISTMNNKHLMIKRDNLKYQFYGEDGEEVLFDLHNDPDELINYISDKNYIKYVKQFRQRRAELGFGDNCNSNYVNAGYQ
ncbi:MAG: sulfatase-like hydrolase/transferase [Spirochaetaceae bacterium]